MGRKMKAAIQKVGIVICNYNKEKEVSECIRCILESKFTDYAIYVVDNASTDASVQRIRKEYGARVTLIENTENMGGSAGFNAGLRVACDKGHPYVMCVDNDAMLDENAIGNLYLFLEEHQEVGMAGAKVYHMEAPAYVQQFGQSIDFTYFCTEVPYYNAVEDGTMPEYLYADAVAACALMVRKSVIAQIGLMPEENFLYWDDTEWCYLCRKAGYRVASVGNAKVLHAMGAKKELENTFPTYYAWRNWITFFAKYTEEAEIEHMAEVFLELIFQNVYMAQHTGSSNRMKTIMLAYDDAIHGVMGKAGENRIFALDVNYEPFHRLLQDKEKIYIEENVYPGMAEQIRTMTEEFGYNIVWVPQKEAGSVTISLCETIFKLEDLSLEKIYVDVNGCILQTEEDVQSVMHYENSLKSFVFGQKPVFLEGIHRIRRIHKEKEMKQDKERSSAWKNI